MREKIRIFLFLRQANTITRLGKRLNEGDFEGFASEGENMTFSSEGKPRFTLVCRVICIVTDIQLTVNEGSIILYVY